MAGEQEMKIANYFQGWLEHRAGGGGSKEPLGSLSLDRFTTVKKKDKGGYKIELSTVSTQPSDGVPMTFKHNTFKSTSKADRDLWYAFITAISQGAVPSNVNLNPSDRAMIEEALQDCVRPGDYTGTLPRDFIYPTKPSRRLVRANTEPVIQTNPPLPPKTDIPSPSGWPDCPPPPPPVGNGRQRRTSTQSENKFNRPLPSVPGRAPSKRFSGISSGSDDSGRRSSTTETRSCGAESGTASYINLDRTDGPFMFHRFYMNKGNCHNVPSWFFENCTRDNAEMILMLGKRYGNIMMRESTTYRQNGSYVIDIREETRRGSGIRHFEVIRVAEGFKIDLLDKEHEPMSCLTEVMNFFTQCMGSDFRPMSTNDTTLIGIPEAEYDRVLNLPQQASSPTGRSPPVEDEIYTLPDNLRPGEDFVRSEPTDEKDYMEMHQLTENLGRSASISQPRPSRDHQPPHQMYDAPPGNKNQFYV